MIEIQDSAHYIHILKVFEVSLLKLFHHSLILIMYGIYLKKQNNINYVNVTGNLPQKTNIAILMIVVSFNPEIFV